MSWKRLPKRPSVSDSEFPFSSNHSLNRYATTKVSEAIWPLIWFFLVTVTHRPKLRKSSRPRLTWESLLVSNCPTSYLERASKIQNLLIWWSKRQCFAQVSLPSSWERSQRMKRGTSHSSFTHLSTTPSTKTSCRHCLNTARSSSGSKTSSKSSNRKPGRAAYLSLRCCPRRRKSSTRRPQRWRMPTVGSSLRTLPCRRLPSKITNHSSNSNRRLSRTSALTLTSSRLWPFSRQKSSRMPSTRPSLWSSKKKSIGSSAPMPSTSRRGSCTKTPSRGSTRSWKISRCPPPAVSSHSRFRRRWCRGRKSLAMPRGWSSSATRVRFDRFIRGWIRAMPLTVALLWLVSSSLAWRIR